jgi:Ca2+/Na+ antiporter
MKIDKFSKDELNYIKELSLKQSTSRKVYFYICALFAPIIFAIYGFVNQDIVAMLIAFFALIIFILWFLTQSFSAEKLLNSICEKIVKDLDHQSSE